MSAETQRYHMSQYTRPYESTAVLSDVIRAAINHSRLALEGRVLDVGCGAGANIHWLDEWGVLTGCEVTGIDEDSKLLAIAQERNPERSFLCASFFDPLPPCETALSIQVLSFIEDWRLPLRELLRAASQWVFVSSLFWEGVETHTHASDGDKVNVHYNVIDMKAFDKVCRRFGGKVEDWRIHRPIEHLTAPKDQLRSRTYQEWTFSGPLNMPWAFAAVRKT